MSYGLTPVDCCHPTSPRMFGIKKLALNARKDEKFSNVCYQHITDLSMRCPTDESDMTEKCPDPSKSKSDTVKLDWKLDWMTSFGILLLPFATFASAWYARKDDDDEKNRVKPERSAEATKLDNYLTAIKGALLTIDDPEHRFLECSRFIERLVPQYNNTTLEVVTRQT
ncbi:uncharacterized protein LOC135843434 isoform X2 [Planococcus citri]|uniref:uncharacterized protein LOC135843434 isoform X2 n=1 Tax=Planococcus citri TaxID=170843 RepID=UPI0031F97960